MSIHATFIGGGSDLTRQVLPDDAPARIVRASLPRLRIPPIELDYGTLTREVVCKEELYIRVGRECAHAVYFHESLLR